MKKTVYIIAFTILGILAQFLLHAFVEVWYIGLLLKDFATFGFGLSWDAWFFIHAVVTAVFFIGGTILGFFAGKKWWQILYVEQRYKNKTWLHWNSLSRKD